MLASLIACAAGGAQLVRCHQPTLPLAVPSVCPVQAQPQQQQAQQPQEAAPAERAHMPDVSQVCRVCVCVRAHVYVCVMEVRVCACMEESAAGGN